MQLLPGGEMPAKLVGLAGGDPDMLGPGEGGRAVVIVPTG